MHIRLGLMAAAFAGLAALSAPANAAPANTAPANTAPANDGRIVVAQGFDIRIGDDRRPRMGERRMRRGPERCRVRIVRERRHGRIVERRTRICR